MAFNDAFAFIALVMLFGLLQCIFLKKPEGQLHAAAE
jgi:hypothetical protein